MSQSSTQAGGFYGRRGTSTRERTTTNPTTPLNHVRGKESLPPRRFESYRPGMFLEDQPPPVGQENSGSDGEEDLCGREFDFGDISSSSMNDSSGQNLTPVYAPFHTPVANRTPTNN